MLGKGSLFEACLFDLLPFENGFSSSLDGEDEVCLVFG
jgi:hypothetical protein